MPQNLPTVRVTNPADPSSFMTINAAEFGEAYELWPEQAEGFDGTALARPIAQLALDPAVRDLAAEIMVGLTGARLDLSHENWSALTGEQKLAALRDAEADVGDLLAIRQGRRLKPYEPDPLDGPLAVAKGPGGRWYVMRGDDRVSRAFATEPEAEAERQRMGGIVS